METEGESNAHEVFEVWILTLTRNQQKMLSVLFESFFELQEDGEDGCCM